MKLENAKNEEFLYHLTKLSNMESILAHGLLPRRMLKEKNLAFDDVANSQRGNQREELNLDSYIPFHFHSHTAFDFTVKNVFSEEQLVYICIGRAFAEKEDFKILTKHPESREDCVLYDYKEGIEKIDWEIMKAPGMLGDYGRNSIMAECVTDQPVLAESFQCILVQDAKTKEDLEEIYQKQGISNQLPRVEVQPDWFEF